MTIQSQSLEQSVQDAFNWGRKIERLSQPIRDPLVIVVERVVYADTIPCRVGNDLREKYTNTMFSKKYGYRGNEKLLRKYQEHRAGCIICGGLDEHRI